MKPRPSTTSTLTQACLTSFNTPNDIDRNGGHLLGPTKTNAIQIASFFSYNLSCTGGPYMHAQSTTYSLEFTMYRQVYGHSFSSPHLVYSIEFLSSVTTTPWHQLFYLQLQKPLCPPIVHMPYLRTCLGMCPRVFVSRILHLTIIWVWNHAIDDQDLHAPHPRYRAECAHSIHKSIHRVECRRLGAQASNTLRVRVQCRDVIHELEGSTCITK